MKKIVLPILFSCLVSFTFGQSLKKATSYLDDKNLEKAKSEIDAFLVKKPDDAEGIYLKSKIYGKIADSAQLSSLVNGDARAISLDAFKKAVADSNNMKAKLMIMKDNYQPIIDIYAGYYAEAANAFNTAAASGSKAEFAKAMDLFIKSNEVGQYMAESKWVNIGKVDTTLVLNIAKSALNAGKNDVAFKYFSELADAKIKGTHGEEDRNFELPYQWLLIHYQNEKDEPNMLKYAALGKELFPDDNYFDLVLIDYYRDKKDYPSLFTKYNQLVTKNPDSVQYHFNYANDIFGYLYNHDDGVVVTNKKNLLNTLHSEIEKAHAIDANDVNTNWLYAQYYYNLGIETRDSALKIKSTKPEDVKTKADLNEEAKTNFTTAIPYGEKAMAQLEVGYKKDEKSKFKSIDNLMQNIYQSLQQKDKLKEYQDKYDQADAKFIN
ncbi:MAG: hypothetical protein Q8891_15245 [Bacteroidota bacterium]|nr:hypothetical protein [Bacteroidota bacterium]